MKRYSLAQLEAFVWICRLGTFRAAADHLAVTQSTISIRISELEAALGIGLFDKCGRSVTLSKDGLVVRRFAERCLETLDDLEDVLQAARPFKGMLRLGAIDAVAMTCLPEVIRELELAYPRLRVQVIIATSAELVSRLDQKQLDMAFLGEPARRESCWFELIGTLETAWIAANGLIDVTGEIEPADLAGLKILALAKPSRLRRIIDEWFLAEKHPTPRVTPCNDISVITRFVVNGLAISVLPTCVVRQHIDSGAVRAYKPALQLAALPLYIAGRQPARDAWTIEIVRMMNESIVKSGILG